MFRLTAIIFCFSINLILAQEASISGFIKDKSNGESAIGASVFVEELKKGTTTNTYGFYSLTVPKGKYHFIFSYVGFEPQKIEVDLNKNLQLSVALVPQIITTEEVIVTGERKDQNVSSSQLGTIVMDMKQIKTLPAFMGEVDILKTVQLLPGVKSSGDGQTGFYVRGGGPDQNLILLDEAVVYNASHLMGFFSVFNGDAIKNVSLTKGGMPAQYGGRLSSVLDITMKEGNSQRFCVEGGIGAIASRLTVEGPIKKDTSSFIISARRTYVDAIVKPIFREGKSPFAGTTYYFYDINAKFNYRFSEKDKVFLSGYFGQDVFKFRDSDADFNVNVPWGNATASLRWNHVFNSKLFSNTSAIFSYYDFSFGAVQENFEMKLFSGIRDYNLKSDFTYFPNTRHNIKFGVNYVFHTYIPTNVSAQQGETKFDFGQIVKLYAHEAHAYVGDDFDVTDWLKVNAGLRFGYFAQVGPFSRLIKDEFGKTIDTVVYKKGEKIVDYNGLEPRISARFALNKSTSIKASYTRNNQFVHLASISSVSLPTDVWMPSTEIIKPQIGNQYAIGFFKNFKDNMFETSVECYFKDMKNLVEYEEGSEPQDKVFDNPDNAFTFGKGIAYGSEFFVKKASGKLTGWIGYTLSWTKRTFESINFGQTFYAKYDRRHDVSIVSNYEHSPRWTMSAVWVYSSGNAGTLPNSLFYFENTISVQYGLRNSYRFPSYHRLDLSVTYTPDRERHLKRKKERVIRRYEKKGKDASTITLPRKWLKHHHSSWTFSVFNAYNRYNPYFIYFDTSGDLLQGTFKVQAKQVSLFPILPSLTWNFKF